TMYFIAFIFLDFNNNAYCRKNGTGFGINILKQITILVKRVYQRRTAVVGLQHQDIRLICLEVVHVLHIKVEHERPPVEVKLLVNPKVKLAETLQSLAVETAVIEITLAGYIPCIYEC